MVIAADYPLLNIFWSMIIFFAWVIWIWMVIVIFADIFSRRDISGWVKAAWSVFIIVVPFLGVLVYLIAHSDDMAERRAGEQKAAQADFDSYVKTVAASGPRHGDREGQGAARQRRHHAGRVRRDQGEGARLADLCARPAADRGRDRARRSGCSRSPPGSTSRSPEDAR